MKKIILLLVLLIPFTFCSPVFAMDDSEVVNSFKQYVDDAMAQVEATYEGNHYNMIYEDYDGFKPMKNYVGWYRSTHTLTPGYKIDVQKTNSLISPYIGTLEVKINYISYLANKNKDIAELEKTVDHSWVDIYTFTIAYQSGLWNVTSVRTNGGELKLNSIVNTLSCHDKIYK